MDARQINLTRFSLLFPEKRSFFLEGAGVFTFASTGPEPGGGIPEAGADVYPFFSRTIGLLEGREVPLDVGVKLTGTVGRTDVGVLDVRTGDLDPFVDEKNFFVGRIKRNIFRESYIGALFTDGAPASSQDGRTYGADLSLATSRFLGASRNLVVNAYGVRSDNTGRPGDDWSYGFSASYPNDKITAQIAWREIQDNFDPALGFVQRDNVRLLRVAGGFNPRPRDFLNIQQMFHDVYFTQFTRLDNGQVESWDVYISALDWHFRSGDSIHGMLDVNPIYERLFEPFEISPGVVLPVGEYRFTRFRTNFFSTANRRRALGKSEPHVGQLLVGHGGAGERQHHLQTPPVVQRQPQHQPDVRASHRRRLRRADRHLERELRGLAAAVVLEPDSVRQPLTEPGLAGPRALDAHAGERSLRGVQPGLGARRRGRSPVSPAGQQAVVEAPVFVPLLRCTQACTRPAADEGRTR